MEVVKTGSRFSAVAVLLPSSRPFLAREKNSLSVVLWFCVVVFFFFCCLLVVVGKKWKKKAKKTLWSSTLKIERRRRRRRRRQHHLCIKKSHHTTHRGQKRDDDGRRVRRRHERALVGVEVFLFAFVVVVVVSSSSRRKISLNTTTLLALNLVQNKKLEENTTPFEKQQEQQQKRKKKSERSVERTKTGSDATRGGFRAPPTPLSKDETNRHQRSSLLSELSGEARLLERRRRREQRNEERKQRIEERINNASPKKSTTANRLDPLAWRSLREWLEVAFINRKIASYTARSVEVTEISTPRKGRRPSMKNDDRDLKICMYAENDKVPSPSSSKTTYTKGPMFALLQPTLVV